MNKLLVKQVKSSFHYVFPMCRVDLLVFKIRGDRISRLIYSAGLPVTTSPSGNDSIICYPTLVLLVDIFY